MTVAARPTSFERQPAGSSCEGSPEPSLETFPDTIGNPPHRRPRKCRHVACLSLVPREPWPDSSAAGRAAKGRRARPRSTEERWEARGGPVAVLELSRTPSWSTGYGLHHRGAAH